MDRRFPDFRHDTSKNAPHKTPAEKFQLKTEASQLAAQMLYNPDFQAT